MADWNPQTPTIRGQEWQPRSMRAVRLDSPLKGVAQRFKASATTALQYLHPYVAALAGEPGIFLEVLDDSLLIPTVTSTDYYPGTDTGATTTGWQDQAAGAANYGEIDDWATDAYLTNTSALATTGTLDLKFRGSTTALTTATRVTKVEHWALLYLSTSTSNAPTVNVQSILDIGGTAYISSNAVQVPRSGQYGAYRLAEYTVSPATGIPWVSTSLDDIWTSTDEFGVRLSGKVAATGFRVAGMLLRVYTCTENRKGFLYTAGSFIDGDGWYRGTLGSTAALVSGAYYWMHYGALTGSAGSYLVTNLLRDPEHSYTTTPTQTGEHRYAVTTQLANQGGNISSVSVQPVEQFAILVDNGSVLDQSNAFAELDTVEVAEKVGGVYLDGTGDYISAPDSAGLSITTDLELQVCVAMDDWTPAAQTTLIGKWTTTGNQRSYKLDVTTSGELRFYWSTDGTAETAANVSSATLGSIGATNGQALWVGVSIDVDNGSSNADVKYYYGTDGVTWTQLGTTYSPGATTSIYNSTAVAEIGSHTAGASANLAGTVYRARYIAGLTRTDIRAEPVLVAHSSFPASLAARLTDATIGDTYNNTWTLQGSAAFQRFGVSQQLTDAAATDYVGVRVPVAWEGSLPPDAPLTVEVRSGTDAAEGRGTLQATAYVLPRDVPDASGKRVDALFPAAWTSAGTTQYHVRFTSTATRGRGWRLFVQDTRSDNLASGTTLANVEGTSQGGQTDSYVDETAVVLDRYDLSGCALITAVSGASSLTATSATAA